MNCISALYDRYVSSLQDGAIINTITQIQIAQVGVIITLLSISIAASKDRIFGLQIKDLLSIKGDLKFRWFTVYIFVQILLTMISVGGLLCGFASVVVYAFLVSEIGSIAICWIYIPIVTITESRAIRIIKEAAISEKTKVNKDKIMCALWEIASQLGCEQSINKLTENLSSTNRDTVISLLFDKVIERIRSIDAQSSRSEIKSLADYADGLIYMDERIQEKQFHRIVGIISATIIRVDKYETQAASFERIGLSSSESLTFNMVKYLGYSNVERREQISMLVICRIVKFSIEDSNIKLLRICRDEFAQLWGFYSERRNSKKYITFLELSRYLLYLIYSNNGIPAKISETIKEFIYDAETCDPHKRIFSWKDMLKGLIDELPIDINEYADAYLGKIDWEYSVYNIIRDVVLDDSSLFDWWIHCRILCCESVQSFQISQISNKYKHHFLDALSQYCDDNTKRYNTSMALNNLVQLLEIEWHVDVVVEEQLYTLKNELAKEIMNCNTHIDSKKLKSLDGKILESLTDRLSNTDLNVKISNMQVDSIKLQTINLWKELPFPRENYLEDGGTDICKMIYDNLVRQINALIDSEPIEIISISETDGSKLLEQLKRLSPFFILN